jgi:hypothetical protein
MGIPVVAHTDQWFPDLLELYLISKGACSVKFGKCLTQLNSEVFYFLPSDEIT